MLSTTNFRALLFLVAVVVLLVAVGVLSTLGFLAEGYAQDIWQVIVGVLLGAGGVKGIEAGARRGAK